MFARLYFCRLPMAYLYSFLVLCLFVTLYLSESTACENSAARTERKTKRQNREITEKDQEEAFEASENRLQQRRILDRDLIDSGRVVNIHERKADPSLIRDPKADPTIHRKEATQLPFDRASQLLAEQFDLSKNDINNYLPTVEITGPLGMQLESACREARDTATCGPNSRYRRADGQCNNLQNPRWGSAMTCQPRLLPPNYVGVSGFRVSVNGDPLPRPRRLSLNVHNNLNRPTNYVTHMYMFFGQLLDHDITLTPQSTTEDNQAIQCCPPSNVTLPQCAPILISRNDPFYSQFNVRCINFVRSAICPTCTFGPRQFMNQLTSTIDASFVYGNSENETSTLRRNDGTGQLRTQNSNYGDLLPASPDPQNDQCSFPETNDICFQTGDPRANQHTVLASLHTIFVREHNRIARVLRNLNGQWDGERIFQETRRILGAQMQSITYKEYLPVTLGSDRMSYFSLWSGRPSQYDPNKDPTILLEFTTAAFRFGHSMINSIIARRPLNASNQVRLLRNEFFQPFDLYNGYAGPLLQGATTSPAQWFDRHLVPDVTNFLYRIRGNQTGLDLAAINIQRGRDHGMPTYVDTVDFCSNGQIRVRNFDDLVRNRLMEPEQANVLRNNYRFVRDIDLWTGIVSEIYNEGAVVGPTAACIIGVQFNNLKFGDRFYFEHPSQAGSFTNEQLQELRQASLSQIICLNTEVQRLPRNAMIFANRNNPYIQCRNVRGINLNYWRE